MRYLFPIVLGILSFSLSMGAQSIDKQTDHVCRRWYIAERLSKPMQLIEQLYNRHRKQLLPLDDLPANSAFSNSLVINCMQSLVTKKNIKPVLHLWHQVQSYKYLNDISLSIDFAQLVCVLLRNCCIRLQQLHLEQEICSQIKLSYEELFSLDTVQVIDLITRVTNYLKGKKYACLVQRRNEINTTQRYIDIGTKDISLRFCLVSRLKKTFDWLARFKNKKISFFKTLLTREQSPVIVDEYVTLYHPRIVLCCKEIAQTESIAPFIALWKQFKRFEEIHDVDFLRDFLKLVFVTYHYLLLGNVVPKNLTIDNLVQEMQNWSAHLNEYSIIEILDLIDVIEHSCGLCKIVQNSLNLIPKYMVQAEGIVL